MSVCEYQKGHLISLQSLLFVFLLLECSCKVLNFLNDSNLLILLYSALIGICSLTKYNDFLNKLVKYKFGLTLRILKKRTCNICFLEDNLLLTI